MADIANTLYSFDEDGILRLQKDLNFMLTHLDERNVKRLYTEYCEISSEGGETVIDGPLLKMYDSSNTLRLQMGYNKATSSFGFFLYNSSGDVTISLDSFGDAVFSGNINTRKDAYVGERLFIGSTIYPLSTDQVVQEERGLYIMKSPSSDKEAISIWYDDLTEAGTISAYGDLYVNAVYGNVIDIGPTGTSDKLVILGGRSSDQRCRMFLNNQTLLTTNSTDCMSGTYIGNTVKQTFLTRSPVSTNRVATDGFVKEKVMKNDAYYLIGRNTKLLAFPTTAVFVSATTATNVAASTRGLFSNGVRVKNIVATTDTFIQATATFASKDLTAFNDNSAATTDDYFVVGFYVESTAVLKNTHGVYIYMGNSSGNYFRYRYSSTFGYAVSTGYNLISRKLGSYDSALGTPALNNISWMDLGWRSLIASSGYGVTFDYFGIHRADQTGSTTNFNDFQNQTGLTYTNIWNNLIGKYLLSEWGTTGYTLFNADPQPSDLECKIDSRNHDTFNVDIDFQVREEGYSPVLSWYHNSSDHISVYAAASVLTVDVRYNATTITDTVNLPTLSYGDNVKWNISKDLDGNIQVIHRQNDTFTNLRNLRCTSPFKSTHRGSLWFGSQGGSKRYLLTDFKSNREF